MNLANLQQDHFQDIKEFRGQYMAKSKVCDRLELHIGRCESDAKAVLKKGVTNLIEKELTKVRDQVEEENSSIIFSYKADRQRYSMLIKESEHEMFQHKDLFPKSIADVFMVLAG